MHSSHRCPRRLSATLLVCLSVGAWTAHAQTDDAGQTCGDGSARPRCIDADNAVAGDAASAGLLAGDSGAAAAVAFYKKVCMNGDPAGTGSCPANPTTVGVTNPTDWACIKDNDTQLIWSLESGFFNWTYATSVYLSATNGTGRCGHRSGWRLPTSSELLLIIQKVKATARVSGVSVFPSAYGAWYWTADTYGPDQTDAWYVDSYGGEAHVANTGSINQVRLVHSGP